MQEGLTKITIDSSVFLSSLLEKDTLRKESRTFFEALMSPRIVTVTEPITVILEVANVLIKTGEKNLSPVLDSFMQFNILFLNETMLQEALFVCTKVHLKAADAILVWAAYVSESTLITWDKVLLRQARHLVPAFTPEDYRNKYLTHEVSKDSIHPKE